MRITAGINNATQLTINPTEISKDKGLEIKINGLNGNPEGGESIFLEYYRGKVMLYVWTDNQQNPQIIVLT
jgi:hypothetical protein